MIFPQKHLESLDLTRGACEENFLSLFEQLSDFSVDESGLSLNVFRPSEPFQLLTGCCFLETGMKSLFPGHPVDNPSFTEYLCSQGGEYSAGGTLASDV